MQKIKDKFKFLPKSHLLAREGEEKGFFPFYTSSPFQNKYRNDYLYIGEAIIIGTGGSPSIHYQQDPFSVSSDCLVLQSISTKYLTKTLYYYLVGNMHILEKGFQGAGLKHISKSYIDKIDIPDIDLDAQKRIVITLDKIQSLVDKRKKSIDLLDKISKATFFEMFGFNNIEFANWREETIEDIVKDEKGSMRTGPFGSNLKHEEFKDSGEVAVLGIDNAVNNVFTWGEKRFISLEKYSQFKNYTIKPKDVIITIMGTVGRSAVIPDSISLAINTKHLAALTLDENKCNPYYLSYAIHSDPYIKHQIKAKSYGAVMDGLNLGNIKKIKLIKPPIEFQNEFEVKYKAILEKKSKLQTSLQILEKIFKSFINKAFREKGIVEKNRIEEYLEDIVLQEDLVGKINSHDFNVKEEYDYAQKLLFDLLESGRSIITQEDKFDEIDKSTKIKLKTPLSR